MVNDGKTNWGRRWQVNRGWESIWMVYLFDFKVRLLFLFGIFFLSLTLFQTAALAQSVTVTTAPSSVPGNSSYTIDWSISGASSVTHTNVHWGTSPSSQPNASSVKTGGSGSYSDTLTAPSSGPIYFFINTRAERQSTRHNSRHG